MIKFKWHTIVEWYSFMTTIAIVVLTLYGSKGTIASLRTSLVEVIVIFIFIVSLSLLWAFSVWVASNAVDFFRKGLKLKGKLTKVNKARNQLDPTAPKIVCYLEKVEGGANATGTIEGTYKDKVAMIAFLIMKVAKGNEKILVSLLLDIIKLSKEMFKYDKAKERKHD